MNNLTRNIKKDNRGIDVVGREAQLIQQSRLAVMGDIISGISHQWCQPLNVIGLILQELQLCYMRGEFSQSYLDDSVAKAMSIVTTMSRNIDNVRSYFTPAEGRVLFQINQVVRRTLTLVEDSFRSQGIVLDFDSAADPAVVGVPNDFSLALLNLLVNSRAAFAERGIAAPRTIAVSTFVEDGKAVVTVGDNAQGIPDEILDGICEPRVTAHGPDRGTGAGLYISKLIIEKTMGGRFTVCNTPTGAEFRIEL